MTVYRSVREVRFPKWDPNRLENSPFTVNILKFAEKKFLPKVAIIFVLEFLAMLSCKLDWPRFGVVVVAPTRQLKSYMIDVLLEIFDKVFWLDVDSDFTVHSLQYYRDVIKNGVCIIIKDGALLLAALNKRTKDRLFGALAVICSDGRYINQNFKGKVVDLQGNVTLIFNITSESFKNYKDRMLGSTFLERMVVVHHVLLESEKEEWVKKEEKTKKLKFGQKITIDDIETDIEEFPPHYLKWIELQAKKWSYLSLRSFIGCQDTIKAIIRAHAALNNRKQLCLDDLYFVTLVRPYLVDPFNPLEGKIIAMKAKGFSDTEICKKLDKSKGYSTQVRRVVEKAKLRGILPLDNE